MALQAQTASPETAIRINKWLEESEFNRFHLKVFLASLILNTMEGYHMFVLGAALPLLMSSLKLTATEAGATASAAAIGTLIGSILLGPVADRIGRRNIILWTSVAACLSMGAAGLSHGLDSFWLARVGFGIANGGMVINIYALVSEYVPGRSRATMVGLIAAGFPFGGMIGTLLGMWALPRYGWRPVFLVASTLIVLLPLYQAWLPEGSSFLAKTGRLHELRTYLKKARPEDPFPENAILDVDKGKSKLPLTEVFVEGRGRATLLFWLCFLVNTHVNYGFTFWLPKLMMNRGFSLSRSLSFMLVLSGSSIVMTFFAGRIVDRIGAKPVLAVLFLLSCVSIVLMGYTHNYTLLMILVALAGIGFNGGQNMMNSYAPAYYRPAIRSTAMSYNFVLGKIGGIVGPMAVGVMLSMHIATQSAMLVLALPSIAAAIAIMNIPERYDYTRNLAR